MIRLSAFADEIALDLQEQVDVLLSENIHFVDLRSAWGTNVLALSDEQLDQVEQILSANGIGVAAIGSPIGKVPIDSPFDQHLQQFERAITVAQRLKCDSIRIFSFYPPANQSWAVDPASYRDEVLLRLRELTARARAANIVLLHENEKDIYGDTIARNVDIFQQIQDPHLRSVLDPANYLQCDQEPYPAAYEATRPWLGYVHVKDVNTTGTLVPVGEGAAHWPELLERLHRDTYDGFFALEPHLSAAGQFQGFSGPDLFRRASQALQELLRIQNWELA